MNVIGHDDKPDTQAIVPGQTTAQMANDDSFRPIRLREISTFVARIRHKLDLFLIIVDPSFDHWFPFSGNQSLIVIAFER